LLVIADKDAVTYAGSMSRDTTRTARDEVLLAVPINAHMGLVFDGREGETAFAHFVADERVTAFGGLHAGVLYSLFEVVALFALIPSLGPTEHAAGVDFHASFMKAVPAGAMCSLRATVVRRGRLLAFVEARAEVDGKPVAMAHLTKSIVPLPPGMPV